MENEDFGEDTSLLAIFQMIQSLKRKPSIIHVFGGREYFLNALSKNNFGVVHLDKDPEELSAGQEVCSDSRHILFDVEKWNWELIASSSCEIIVFARVLHHLTNLKLALQNACQALKSGGTLLVADFSQEQLNHELARLYFIIGTGGYDAGIDAILKSIQGDMARLEKLGFKDKKSLVIFFQSLGMSGTLNYEDKFYIFSWEKP